MNNKKENLYQDRFKKNIQIKEDRKIKAQSGSGGALQWLGLLGMVGWSVSLPLIAGIALGLWIDRQFPSKYSFTVMLMFTGLIGGCVLAWYWMKRSIFDSGKRDQEINKEERKKN